MAKGGDIIALGKSLQAVTDHFDKALPLGMKLVQVQDQPKAVANSVNEFIKVLIEAVAIVLAVSFLSLGLHKRPGQHPLWRRWTLDIRPGLVVGITIPLVLAMTFLAMHYWGHRPAQDFARLADHRAGPAGGRRDHCGRDDGAQDGRGLRQGARGHLRLRAHRHAHADRYADHGSGLPCRLASPRSMTGEYTFAIFAVTVIALVLSWIVSVYFVPYLGTLLLKTPPHVVAATEAGAGARRTA
jgi:multidrug efflux pump